MQSSRKALVAAGVIGAAALLGGIYIYSRKQAPGTSSASEAAVEKEAAAESTEAVSAGNETSAPSSDKAPLAKEKLVEILKEIVLNLNQLMAQLVEQEKMLREKFISQGQMTTEQGAEYLMGMFQENMKALEARIYAKHSVTEAEVAQGSMFWASDETVDKHLTQLRMLIQMVMGDQEETVLPDHVDLPLVLSIMRESMSAMNSLIEVVADQVKATGLVPGTDAFQEAVGSKFAQEADAVTKTIHAKNNLTREQFQAAMLKFQNEKELVETMMGLQEQQYEKFKECGLNVRSS